MMVSLRSCVARGNSCFFHVPAGDYRCLVRTVAEYVSPRHSRHGKREEEGGSAPIDPTAASWRRVYHVAGSYRSLAPESLTLLNLHINWILVGSSGNLFHFSLMVRHSPKFLLTYVIMYTGIAEFLQYFGASKVTCKSDITKRCCYSLLVSLKFNIITSMIRWQNFGNFFRIGTKCLKRAK